MTHLVTHLEQVLKSPAEPSRVGTSGKKVPEPKFSGLLKPRLNSLASVLCEV